MRRGRSLLSGSTARNEAAEIPSTLYWRVHLRRERDVRASRQLPLTAMAIVPGRTAIDLAHRATPDRFRQRSCCLQRPQQSAVGNRWFLEAGEMLPRDDTLSSLLYGLSAPHYSLSRGWPTVTTNSQTAMVNHIFEFSFSVSPNELKISS